MKEKKSARPDACMEKPLNAGIGPIRIFPPEKLI
jgi:hypothetical protein